MFDLNFCFGMFELGSGAKIGRPCYLVISATGGVRPVDATRVFMLHLDVASLQRRDASGDHWIKSSAISHCTPLPK
jgi:hypothetical protein